MESNILKSTADLQNGIFCIKHAIISFRELWIDGGPWEDDYIKKCAETAIPEQYQEVSRLLQASYNHLYNSVDAEKLSLPVEF